MLPPVTVNNRPNPVAMLFAAMQINLLGEGAANQPILLTELINFITRDRPGFQAWQVGNLAGQAAAHNAAIHLARNFGADEILWSQDRARYELDWSMFFDRRTLWISLYGTENLLHLAGYYTNCVPAYDFNIGAFTLQWARGQAQTIFERVRIVLERSLPAEVVVCGHSLGGAVATILARYIGNALTITPVPRSFGQRAFEQIGYALGTVPALRRSPQTALATWPIDVLTFGEPRSMGDNAQWGPRSHWRIVAVSDGRLQPINMPAAYVAALAAGNIDWITLLPPNIITPAGLGVFNGLPGLAWLAAKIGLGLTPIHYGTPIYLNWDGRVIPEPLAWITRFTLELGAQVALIPTGENTLLHLLPTVYIPGSRRLAENPHLMTAYATVDEPTQFINTRLGRYILRYIDSQIATVSGSRQRSSYQHYRRQLELSTGLEDFRQRIRRIHLENLESTRAPIERRIEVWLASPGPFRQTDLGRYLLHILNQRIAESTGGQSEARWQRVRQILIHADFFNEFLVTLSTLALFDPQYRTNLDSVNIWITVFYSELPGREGMGGPWGPVLPPAPGPALNPAPARLTQAPTQAEDSGPNRPFWEWPAPAGPSVNSVASAAVREVVFPPVLERTFENILLEQFLVVVWSRFGPTVLESFRQGGLFLEQRNGLPTPSQNDFRERLHWVWDGIYFEMVPSLPTPGVFAPHPFLRPLDLQLQDLPLPFPDSPAPLPLPALAPVPQPIPPGWNPIPPAPQPAPPAPQPGQPQLRWDPARRRFLPVSLLQGSGEPEFFSSFGDEGGEGGEGETTQQPTEFANYFLGSISGENEMTLLKGTIEFNSEDWGGWSESVYSDVPTDTLNVMMGKMRGWISYRMQLSVGPDNIGCANPVTPFAIRVEDELVLRDGIVQYFIQPNAPPEGSNFPIPPGFTVSGALGAIVAPSQDSVGNQNLDMQLGARVTFVAGQGGMTASPMFHGVPVYALNNGALNTVTPGSFDRHASMSGPWLQNLRNLTQYMAQTGLGYRSISGAWNGANNTNGPSSSPTDWYYNPSNEMIELQFAASCFPGLPGGTFPITPSTPLFNVPPWFPGQLGTGTPPVPGGIGLQASPTWPQLNSKCRLQVRGWRTFKVGNGRWSAVVVPPQTTALAGYPGVNPYTKNTPNYAFAIRILRQFRQPTDATTPYVSPIAWNAWWPGEFSAVPPGSTTLPGVVAPTSFQGAPQAGTIPANNIPGGSAPQWLGSIGIYQYIESKKLGRLWGAERGRQRNRPT